MALTTHKNYQNRHTEWEKKDASIRASKERNQKQLYTNIEATVKYD